MKIQNLKFYYVYAASLSLIILAAIVQFNTYLAPDLGWHLNIAKGMLAGKRLYVDFFEVNTPLIIYITEIPTLISKLLHVDIAIGLNLFNFMLSTISLLFCHGVIQRSDGNNILLFFIAFGLFIIPLSYPMSEFGQKEHVFMMLFLPYLLEFLLKLKPQTGLFILAAIGMLIKPFFILAYLGIFVVRLSERDRMALREVAILVAMNIAYSLWIWVAHPAYFDIVIPLALDGYKDLNLSDDTFISSIANFSFISLHTLNFMLFPLVLSLFILTKNSARVLPILLALFIMVYIQGKSFWYHYIPFVTSTTLLFGLLFIETSHSKQLFKTINLAFMFVYLLGAAFMLESTYQNHNNNKYAEVANVIKEYKNQRVMFLSPDLAYIFPIAIYSNLELNMKEHSLQLLEGVFKHPQQMGNKKRALDYIENDIIQALKHKPAAVFVLQPNEKVFQNKWSYAFFFKAGHNYIDFFSQYGEFKRLWQSYTFKREVGNEINKFKIYELKEGL